MPDKKHSAKASLPIKFLPSALCRVRHSGKRGCPVVSGVCHQLSNGFELKHDMLSGDEGVKIKSTRVSSNLNLDNAPLLTCGPLLRLCKSNVKHAYFMYITSTCIHLDQWKSFMKFGIKKSHEMISYNLSWIALLSEWNYRSSTKP